MKILHTVQSYSPSVGGMQEVVRQLSERLARRGHDVTVATSCHPLRSSGDSSKVKIAEFDIAGNLVQGMNGEVGRYQEFVLGGGFDIVANFAAQQWATDALLPILDRIVARKVFVPTGFSMLYDPRYRDYFAMMPRWLKQYDMNVFLSERYRDIEFARGHQIKNCVVIPNGAAEEEFLSVPHVNIRAKLGIPARHFLVLHVGSHTGLKGHDDAIRIFGRSRLRSATLLLVGNDHGPGTGCIDDCRRRSRRALLNPFWRVADKRLSLCNLSREETVAAFHAADVFLFPSRIECSPLVLFETMASRTAFLTTAAGNAEEIIEWSNGGILLPSIFAADGSCQAETVDSSRILTKVWQDVELRNRLANNGFSAWEERFSWGNIAKSYEKLYVDLLGSR